MLSSHNGKRFPRPEEFEAGSAGRDDWAEDEDEDE
jgi:hypothetical protein